jgi:hypothetical protein
MKVDRATIMINMVQMQVFRRGKVARLGLMNIIPDYIGLLTRDRGKLRELTRRLWIGINSMLRAA